MKAYLAGPMRGYAQWNFPAFDKNAAYLRSLGWEVISPAEIDREIGFDETDGTAVFTEADFMEAMRRDYAALLTVDAIALMIGWEQSTGANMEHDFSKKLGHQIFLVDVDSQTLESYIEVPKTPFLQVIDEIVAMHDKKQKDYGRTGDPFANVRASADFGVEAWVGCMIRANDKMKRIQKAASGGTLVNESVEDSLLDLAVYSIIGLALFRESHA